MLERRNEEKSQSGQTHFPQFKQTSEEKGFEEYCRMINGFEGREKMKEGEKIATGNDNKKTSLEACELGQEKRISCYSL